MPLDLDCRPLVSWTRRPILDSKGGMLGRGSELLPATPLNAPHTSPAPFWLALTEFPLEVAKRPFRVRSRPSTMRTFANGVSATKRTVNRIGITARGSNSHGKLSRGFRNIDFTGFAGNQFGQASVNRASIRTFARFLSKHSQCNSPSEQPRRRTRQRCVRPVVGFHFAFGRLHQRVLAMLPGG